MTYLYEQLTPEPFQLFCQALLTSQFPNAQCLPVGQPDGGRDAYLWSMRAEGAAPDELIVFQIKFSREPERADPGFIRSIIETELPKVERLKEKGISSYYLLTNVSGSAHLDAGSVDKVHNVLKDDQRGDVDCVCGDGCPVPRMRGRCCRSLWYRGAGYQAQRGHLGPDLANVSSEFALIFTPFARERVPFLALKS